MRAELLIIFLMFASTLLGPELFAIDGNPLGYNNGTQLRIPLSASEGTKDGTDDSVFD